MSPSKLGSRSFMLVVGQFCQGIRSDVLLSIEYWLLDSSPRLHPTLTDLFPLVYHENRGADEQTPSVAYPEGR